MNALSMKISLTKNGDGILNLPFLLTPLYIWRIKKGKEIKNEFLGLPFLPPTTIYCIQENWT